MDLRPEMITTKRDSHETVIYLFKLNVSGLREVSFVRSALLGIVTFARLARRRRPILTRRGENDPMPARHDAGCP